MAGQFGPWGWIAWYLVLKCLLDTVVLVPKCRDALDPSKKCQSVSVSGPKCPVTITNAHPSVVIHLIKLFNLILKHSYVPNAFGKGVVVPLIKD